VKKVDSSMMENYLAPPDTSRISGQGASKIEKLRGHLDHYMKKNFSGMIENAKRRLTARTIAPRAPLICIPFLSSPQIRREDLEKKMNEMGWDDATREKMLQKLKGSFSFAYW